MNYKINDTVLYGSDGVCRISEITKRKIGTETMEYYILKPIYDEKSTILVPVANLALLEKMKRILSEAEIYSALKSASKDETLWIENDSDRKIKFKEIIEHGNIVDILCLMKTICLHKDKQTDCGKKLHVSDERFLKETEKILFDEIAHVLDIERTNVKSFIDENLGLT